MAAYGLGELPGTSITEAADIIQGETGDLLHLPQLPSRGLGADAIGRSVGLIDALTVTWCPFLGPQRPPEPTDTPDARLSQHGSGHL